MFQAQIITDLTSEPVTLAEVKTFLEIDYTDFDTLLTSLIKSARIASEKFTGQSYGKKIAQVQSTQGRVELPFGKFGSISAIVDEDNEAIPAINYTLFGFNPGIIAMKNWGIIDPMNYDSYFDILGTALNKDRTFTATYSVGYFTQVGEVVTNTTPGDLIEAIKKRVANAFQYREDVTNEAINECINQSVYTEFSYRNNALI